MLVAEQDKKVGRGVEAGNRQQEEEKEAEPSNLLVAGETKLQQGHLNQSENCYQSPSAR